MAKKKRRRAPTRREQRDFSNYEVVAKGCGEMPADCGHGPMSLPMSLNVDHWFPQFDEPRQLAEGMSPVCRKIVKALCYGGEMPLSDLAEQLGWPESTISANFQGRKTQINREFKAAKSKWRIERRSHQARLMRLEK